MHIDGHYDPSADIAWLRFEGYDPKTVPEEAGRYRIEQGVAAYKVNPLPPPPSPPVPQQRQAQRAKPAKETRKRR